MKLEKLKDKTKNLLLINKSSLKTLEPRDNILNANIKYWIKTNQFISLKKGLYLLRDKYEKELQKDFYLEYIANQLVQPSYISTEYVLAKYQILTEPVNAITSVTTKTTREIINKLGAFRYYSISPKLFQGYKIVKFYNAPIAIAEKEKALFDFLYIRFIKNAIINKEAIENLRLNWENISKKEFYKLFSYSSFTKSKKIKTVLEIIKKLYYA